jgi:hypothetical protein
MIVAIVKRNGRLRMCSIGLRSQSAPVA